MYHRIILFLMMFVGLLVELKAQNFNSKQVEDLSYQNFLNGNHEQQIKLIETVLPLGIDYYYLRVRLGIAYMAKGNYRTALFHFNKAKKFNRHGVEAISYIRDCSLALGMDNLDRLSKKESGIPVGFLKMIYAETGMKQSSFADTIGHTYFAHYGMQFALGSKLTSYQAYSFAYQNTLPLNVRQHQYYTHLAYKPSVNWQINGNFSYLIANIQLNTNDSVYNEANYVYGFSIIKHHKKFDYSLNASYSYLNLKEQIQGGIALSYFVFGNDLLQLRMQANAQYQDSVLTPIYIPSATIKLFRNCWLKGEYIIANTSNFIEQDAFITNNNPDKTFDKATLMLNYKIKSRHDFYLLGQLENKEVDPIDKPAKPYQFKNIILGYSIKF